MIENFSQKVLVGMYVIGQILGPISKESIETITLLLVGHYDYEVKCGLYYQRLGKPEELSDLEHPKVLEMLEVIKSCARATVQLIFDEEEKRLQFEVEQRKCAVDAKIREAEKPSELGTVAEIAAKFGISKSEVRRMKTAGTLHTLETKHGQ